MTTPNPQFDIDIDVRVVWRSVWYSKYQRGTILASAAPIDRIYRHKKSGQIRLYSPQDLDGRQIAVNDAAPVTVRSRGRFGKLYIGE